MSTSLSPLFSPLTIGSLTLAGRVYKAATSETRASEDGFVTDDLIEFYEPIAKAGTPLIITGNMHVSPDGQATPRMCGIDKDNKIPGLKRLTAAIHEHGVKIFVQLNHVGRQVIPAYVGLKEAIAPSAVKELAQGTMPRAMTVDEIRRVINDFANAAQRAQLAGFDGVQIHCAHGYLISQFLTPYTNRRSDEYGGSFENRLRFLQEVYRAIRGNVGDKYPVIIKLNGADYLPLRNGLKTKELVRIAEIMQQEGVNAVEISVAHYESGGVVFRGTYHRLLRAYLQTGFVNRLPFFHRWGIRIFWPLIAIVSNIIWFHREGFNSRYAKQFKNSLTIPILCVGGFQQRKAMERALNDKLCDAVTSARSFIADPYLYRHLRENSRGPQCVFCNSCVGRVGSQPVDCYHPRVRAEKDIMLANEN